MNVMEETLKRKIDPALTAENLSLLSSRALGEEVAAVSAKVLTGGCWNRVVSVSLEGERPDIVFKINPQTGDERLKREYGVLDYFSNETGMPVPKPLLLDITGDVIPGSVLIMGKLPGHVLHHVFGYLPPQAQRSVTEQIGHYIGELHRSRVTGFGGVELSEEQRIEAWRDFWLPRFDEVFRDVSEAGVVRSEFLTEVDASRQRFPAFLDIGPTATLTHYDIWSGNVMVETDGGSARVTGFLDIPGFWADYARELSFMEMFGMADAHLYDLYGSYHTLDEGFEIRKNIYNLKMHLKHIMMYPDQSYYRRGAEACLGFIRQAG